MVWYFRCYYKSLITGDIMSILKMIGLGLATKRDIEKAKFEPKKSKRAEGRYLGRFSVDELDAIYHLDEDDLP